MYVFHAPDTLSSFTGRTCQIKEIEVRLNNDDQLSPSSARKAAICGLGGSGKTSLAVEYAHRKKSHYQGGVFWFSGEDEKNLENSVNELALSIGTFASNCFAVTLSRTLARISRIEKPWLLIIDDMDELQLSSSVRKLLSGSWQKHCKGHIIVTTRRKPDKLIHDLRAEEIKQSSCLDLQCFNVDDTIAFLFHRTGIERNEDTEAAARNIFEELGGLPLALEQAAAYIKCLGCSFTSYLETYKAKHLALLNQQTANPVSEYSSGDRLAVQTTWLLNIDYIKKNSEGANAMLFLNACLFFDPNEIQKELINVGEPPIKDEQFQTFLGTALGRYQIIKLLTDFSLFKQCSSHGLQVHRLVVDVIKGSLSRSEQDKSFVDAVRLLRHSISKAYSPDELFSSVAERGSSVFDYTNPSIFYTWRKLCAHAGEIEKNLKMVCQDKCNNTERPVFFPETAQIVYQHALYLSVFCRHEEAVRAMNFALKILDWAPKGEYEFSTKLNSLFPHLLPLPEFIRIHIQYCSKAPALPSHVRDECVDSPSEINSGECEELRVEGNRSFLEGHFREAVEFYSIAIETETERTGFPDPRFFSNRSSAYLRLGLYEKALEDAETYASIRPKCWKGYARKALALHGMGCDFAAEVAAVQTYNLAPDVFSEYGPFKNFRYLQECTRKCYSKSDLLPALINRDALTVVFLNPGVYEIGKDVEFENSCIVLGCMDQPRSSRIRISFTGNSSAVVHTKCALLNLDFLFDQGHFQYNPPSTGVLHNCSFTNRRSLNQPSFKTLGVTSIKNCNFTSDDAGGFLCIAGASRIENCKFFNNGKAGLEVRKGGTLLAKNVHSYNNGLGLMVGPQAKKCVLTNSQINCNAGDGIFVCDCSHDNAEIQLSNNSIFHNGCFGISVIDSSATVTENRIFENNWWGVWLQSNSSGCVSKNDVTGNRLGGIRIGKRPNGWAPSVVEFNTITDNRGPGLIESIDDFDVNKFICNQIFPVNSAYPLYKVPLIPSNLESTLVSARYHGNFERCNEMDNTKTQSSNFLSKVDHFCSYCRKKSTLSKCTKCYSSEYCGETCQKKHWKAHSILCQSLMEQSSILLTSTTPCGGHYNGFEDVGPNYSKPPSENGKRFIVKVQQVYNEYDFTSPLLVIYGRSLTIREQFQSAHVQNLIRDLGAICQRKYVEKQLFMWAAYTDDKVIRLFTNDFPPYQPW